MKGRDEGANRKGISRRDFLKGIGVATLATLVASTVPRRVFSQVKYGGVLHVDLHDNPPSLDDHVHMLRIVNLPGCNIHEPLIYQDESTRELYPALATEWEYIDPQTFSLTLRDGVQFHNGEPFTAEDVKYTIERIQNPETGSYMALWLEEIEEVEIVDPLHVRLHLTKPLRGLPEILSRPPIHSHTETEEEILTKPIGTGPFKFVEWVQHDHITLEKNPKYWERSLPYLDGLVYHVIPDATTRLSNLLTGQLDVLHNIDPKDVSRLAAMSGVIVGNPSFNDILDFCYINCRPGSPFASKELRQAFAYAFNSEEWYKVAMHGLGFTNRSCFCPGHWAHHPGIAHAYPHDMEKAKELLSAAGYPGGKGLEKIQLITLIGFPEWATGNEMIQAAFGELGVDAEIKVVDTATWIDLLITNPDPKRAHISWDHPLFGASEPVLFYKIPWTHAVNPKNICGLQTIPGVEEYAEYVEKGNTAPEREERKKWYFKAQEWYTERVPGLQHGFRVRPLAWRSWVKNFTVPYSDFARYREVWIDK